MTKTLRELRKEPHWSYSSINGFFMCSLAWAFRYVYHHRPEFTPAALVFGRCFHKALEFTFRENSNASDVQTSVILDLFSDLLVQEIKVTEPEVAFEEGDDADKLNTKGRDMLQAYLESIVPEEKVLGVSVPFSVPLLDADGEALSKPLIGEYDLLVENPEGRTVIVDWKTSARRYSEQQVITHIQPTCYLMGHVQDCDSTPRALFRFDVVTKTKTPVVHRYLTRREPEHFRRLIERIKIIEKAIRHECFLPNDESWCCKNCPYSLSCEAWHREMMRGCSLYDFKLVA